MKMSKMKMPEMSVVRFEECDVICASTGIRLNKFGNGLNGDAYVTYNGVDYGNTQGGGRDLSAFYNAFNNDHNTGINEYTKIGFETGEGGYIDFYGAQALDNAGATSEIDGPYVWNGSMFGKQ